MSESDPLPSLSDAPWLTAAATQRVLGTIETGGFAARAVGGVVRNALMGLPVTDIDIATTALPDDVIRLARAAGLGVAKTGLKHGTVTVIADHHPFEVTTLRRDVETHGRHATVDFTTDWAADAQPARLHNQRSLLRRSGPGARSAGRLPRRPRPAGAVHRRGGRPHPRGLPAHPEILPLHGRVCRRARAGGPAACTRLRDGLAQLSKERIRQELVASSWPAAPARRSSRCRSMGSSAKSCRRRRGRHCSPALSRSKQHSAGPLTPCAGLPRWR